MREEYSIFQSLLHLCTSPGYIHALAYLQFRDSVIGYSDQIDTENVRHLFSLDRLIRTETSTLLGLMVQKNIDSSLPSPEITQRYIDETEKLLKELHECLSLPTLQEIKESISSGRKTNPFDKGPSMREPIFYTGESAYSFQFRDISVAKYQADNPWLTQSMGFSIEDAREVVHALVRLQNRKFGDNSDLLWRSDPASWSFLPCFLFTKEELADFSCIEIGTISLVLDAFTLSRGCYNTTFRALNDFNAVTAKPIVPIGDEHLFLLEQYSLQQSLYESPFFWMVDDKAYRDTAAQNRGSFVEAFASARLEAVFGKSNVFMNVRIPGTKGRDAGEIDVLVLFADRAIIVQAKSKRLTLDARRGNDNVIRDDFKKSVQDSYDQAFSCAEMLTAADCCLLTTDGLKVNAKEQVTEIYLFCVVADHYPALSFQTRQFLRRQTNSYVRPPFVLDIFTLDIMVEMLARPMFFMSYVERRVSYDNKVLASHELTILAYHLKRNLWFESEYNMAMLDDDFTADLDIAMMVRREGAPGKPIPDGILTRVQGTRIGEIIRAIESEPNSGTVSLAFCLLRFSEHAIVNLSKAIDQILERTRNDGLGHDLTMPMGESGEGLTIHCNMRPLDVAGRSLGSHCFLRKYRAKAKRWYGFCLAPDGGLRLGLFANFEWEKNSEMGRVLSALPPSGLNLDLSAPGFKARKIGRNERCPCGSGRKYKKCCLM